ncbi:serine/threonine phosphatase [Malassezia pachydermatis]
MPPRFALRRRVCLSDLARTLSTSSQPTRKSPARIAASSRGSSSNSPTDAYKRQRRTEWVIVGVAGSAAAFGTWYYWANMRSRPTSDSRARRFSMSAKSSSFTIPAVSKEPGQNPYKVITPLTPDQVDIRLRENERSTRVDRPAGACLVARYDTNSVASNNPIEDKHAEVIVERDRGIHEPKAERTASAEGLTHGDLCFFTVMDGHGGEYTSHVLSRKLIAFVALELDKVFKETGEYAKMARSKMPLSSSVWRSLFSGSTTENSHRLASAALDGDPEIVKRALVKGFRGLDKEIVNTPLELLKQYELSLATLSKDKAGSDTNSLSTLAHSIWPSSLNGSNSSTFPTISQATAYESILPALSGSCALMVYVDSARRDLYVASTGDSRAVAGYWDERAGRWEVEALSIDQTGRNPSEVKRIQREHPADEAPFVIQRGRVLGGLEPTRAFGDARYKWDRTTQDRIAEAFLPSGGYRKPPRLLKTPPYVTAEPVVEWRHVNIPSDSTPSTGSSEGLASSLTAGPLSSSSSTRELRFIIMATDGLWDLLSNEEAVGLVAGHLAGMRGAISANDLQRRCFQPSATIASNAATSTTETQPPVGVHHPLLKAQNQQFTFEDDNLSTHLVRNALGGAAHERVGGLLAIPSPESRRYRDDVRISFLLTIRLLSSMCLVLRFG